MNNECPNCHAEVELTERYSKNCRGTNYTAWCPNCGAIAEWYDSYPWPEKTEWKIPILFNKDHHE